MSNIATIGGSTQFAKAVVVVQLTNTGFPIDPVTGIPSTNDTVLIGGVASPVVPVALFTLDQSGNNPLPGGASVPANAPIQPPQAFVDNVEQWFTSLSNSSGVLNLANKGITFINPGTTAAEFGVFAFCQGASAFNTPSMNFSGNAITNTDAILAACLAQGVPNGVLNISGGTNATPTKDVPGNGTVSIGTGFTSTGAGDYVKLPGPIGPLVFWFNVDGGNTQPDIGVAATYVEVDILGTNGPDANAEAFTSVLNTNGYTASHIVEACTFAGSAVYLGSALANGGMGISNLAYTAASNAAKNALVAAGWTVTTN